ncbi:MAG TPA: pilus assembly protein TadG-related protein [Azospirillum sp.]|nr:pilus assembly protein TadG-related protein [Azospirillum sp.]
MILFAVLVSALVGIVGLSLDLGRLYTTNTQAKSAADASALAAATVLAAALRAPGADPSTPQPVIDAVWQAAQQGVRNRHNFATVSSGGAASTGGTVQITNVRLLTSLPELNGGSSEAAVDAYVTTDPWQAHFVEVTTETLSQDNLFIPVLGGSQTSNTQARAIAGYTQVMCNITPVWICNPAEVDGAGTPFNADDWRGREILLRSAAPGSAWSPGNFGLLDGPYGQSVPAVTRAMAMAAPEVCFRSPGVDLRPGEANPVVDGLNTRFDIYGSPHLSRNDPNYRPALNVAKGFKFNNPSCTMNGSNPITTTPDKLPRDTSFGANGRLGNGVWDCLTYWNDNHAGHTAPADCTNPSQMTRYELYRHEIDNGLLSTDGAPHCYQGATPIPADPDRRMLYFAIINCSQQGLNGNRSDVPVTAFGKAFLTEPVSAPPNDEIVIEIVDVVRPGADDGVLHEIVQLYR